MTKEKKKSLLITIAVILAAVLVIGLTVYNRLSDSGVLLRNKTAAESPNYKVDGMMMAYFYGSQYQSYYSYLSYLGVDTSVSLKQQECPYYSNGTWFDYFVDMTKDYVTEILALCEGAREAGITLDDSDRAAIDENIQQLEDNAALYGYTANNYLLLTMGNPIKTKDVKKCMELNTLAGKYYNQFMDSLNYSDAEIQAYYEENKDTIDGVDYYSYSFYSSDYTEYDANDNPVTSSDADSAKAHAAAEQLAAAASGEEFESTLTALLNVTLNSDEDSINSAVKNTFHQHYTKAQLAGAGTDVSDWAFSASAGDSYTVGEEGDSSFTVYLLARAPYADETKSRDVRHILFTYDSYEDDTKVNEVYSEWEAAGFSEDKFIELVSLWSEDPGSVENGGLYEDVVPGQMVEEFEDWLFAAKNPGDHGIIESDYGWHIMYFAGEGDLSVWQLTAKNELQSADYSEMLAGRSNGITFKDKAIAQINA